MRSSQPGRSGGRPAAIDHSPSPAARPRSTTARHRTSRCDHMQANGWQDPPRTPHEGADRKARHRRGHLAGLVTVRPSRRRPQDRDRLVLIGPRGVSGDGSPMQPWSSGSAPASRVRARTRPGSAGTSSRRAARGRRRPERRSPAASRRGQPAGSTSSGSSGSRFGNCRQTSITACGRSSPRRHRHPLRRRDRAAGRTRRRTPRNSLAAPRDPRRSTDRRR